MIRALILASLIAAPAYAQPVTYPPYSWLEHCNAQGNCGLGKKWQVKDLEWINKSVNGAITARNDAGFDVWTAFPADRLGDCDDYAATKRAALLTLGYPAEAMRMASGYLPTGEMHLVLEVDLGGKTYVLDNTMNRVFRADDRPYFWRPIMTQVPGDVAWKDHIGFSKGDGE